MKYKNTRGKKVKGSHLLLLSCGHCKKDLVKYQKVGKGGLINLYLDRILEAEIDFNGEGRALVCPDCKEQLASKTYLKNERVLVYRMVRSSFNTRRLE